LLGIDADERVRNFVAWQLEAGGVAVYQAQDDAAALESLARATRSPASVRSSRACAQPWPERVRAPWP